MADAEVQKSGKCRSDVETKSAIIALIGFILSVFFIVWALIILVRFYIFDNILYNLFLFCMMVLGIGFNISSLNLILSDFTEHIFLLPFVVGLPVTIFWTVLCIILPLYKHDFFSQFSFMPIAEYDASFYDGLGHDPNNTKIHPFAKPFVPENSFFENSTLIWLILVIASITQVLFWLYTTTFYFKLKGESEKIKVTDEGTSKDL